MIKVIFALAQPWKAALYFKTGEETINFFGPFLDGVPEYPQSLPGKPSAKNYWFLMERFVDGLFPTLP